MLTFKPADWKQKVKHGYIFSSFVGVYVLNQTHERKAARRPPCQEVGKACCLVSRIFIFMICQRVIPGEPVTDFKLALLSFAHSVLWHVFRAPTACNTQNYHVTLLRYVPRGVWQSHIHFKNTDWITCEQMTCDWHEPFLLTATGFF